MVPVTAEDFSDPDKRQEWIQYKGMKVLNFHSDQHKFTRLDIFVYEPFNFDDEYEKSLFGEIAAGLFVHFVSIPILIEMKKLANRPRDIDDIEHLQMIMEETNKNESS